VIRGAAARRTGSRWPVGLAVYAAILAATVLGFLAIRVAGEGLPAPPRAGGAAFGARDAAAAGSPLAPVLGALIVVVAAARGLGIAFRRLGQPPVIGEVVAGIVLGPSLLGWLWPAGAAAHVPAEATPALRVLAEIGVVLFMFLVGLELDLGLIARRTQASVAVSHASIVVPFLLGATLALWIYPVIGTADVPFTVFALFLGVAMSVTAFPVLARILRDLGMQRTQLGAIALGCAAVDDVTAWILLALVVGVARASLGDATQTFVLTAAYVVVLVTLVRPLVARAVRGLDRRDELPESVVAGACVALLASAFVTEAIGIHALFGAFALGALVPHDARLATDLERRLGDPVRILLLPAYFAYTGLRTEIGLLAGPSEWLLAAVVIAVASLGKFGGSYVAARLTGLEPRTAASLGVLLNTRGLMELVVLNIGLDLGVISPTLFAIMVVMALVTTLATTPVVARLVGRGEG
jgi:Kef-type K+ transport system membrane component KefB